jgi:hypothetical protein
MSSPQLCGDCETLVKWLSSNPDQRPNYQYPKDGQATIESAEQCRLCRMITWRFGTGPSSQSDKKAERITLQVERDWDGFISTVEVTHYWSPKNFSCTKLPIWTEKGGHCFNEVYIIRVC